jgi:hypothetical protein
MDDPLNIFFRNAMSAEPRHSACRRSRLAGAHFWREEKAKHSTCRFGIYVTDELQDLCECNKLL